MAQTNGIRKAFNLKFKPHKLMDMIVADTNPVFTAYRSCLMAMIDPTEFIAREIKESMQGERPQPPSPAPLPLEPESLTPVVVTLQPVREQSRPSLLSNAQKRARSWGAQPERDPARVTHSCHTVGGERPRTSHSSRFPITH
jgi:hypothetical protein